MLKRRSKSTGTLQVGQIKSLILVALECESVVVNV